ncbi:MarR family transcriptional regulator [Streptomyces sp. SID14478]|uniref:MarR family winged helix-turn-helix transcriptional regulator n=1 Tax=Streptomyces sp. SID14478 TaxID=2706073 RepID=UPI0013DC9177|nr:MarR family transcriptional regulator [Streptomyces sp. SID14478]NEB76050.1 MarR family transcriptional regulator [Streptomyces sp. SID14478]
MSSVASGDAARRRRRATVEVQQGLRELSAELTLLNRKVGTRLGLKDTDLDCLDLINAHGPLSPTALAQRAGLHAATMTGVLDRLERAGWIARERDPADRRASLVRALRDRNAELLALFAGMNSSLELICSDYDAADLERLAGFLRRTADAGRKAAGELDGKP